MKRAWLLCALLGCELEPLELPSPPLEGQLTLELRDSATVRIEPRADGTSAVTITPTAGYGLLEEDVALSGDGRVEVLIEAGATLYTAKLSAPAQSGGPCGADPISLALALHRPTGNATVVGGLSAYCGADTWFGKPVRVLRLSGPLQP